MTVGWGMAMIRIVLAPSSVQEMYDLTCLAFNLSDKYRNPAMILGDALIGQMKEPLLRKKCEKMDLPPKDWALTGAQGRKPNRLKSLYLQDGDTITITIEKIGQLTNPVRSEDHGENITPERKKMREPLILGD
jgi:pyruvate/2-oxoacid:ferredoxin oxidoreductase alpha subunit